MADIKIKGVRRRKLDDRVSITPKRKPGEDTDQTQLGVYDPKYGRRRGGKSGRPTEYRQIYCQQILDYFGNADAWEINTTDKGAQQVIPKHKMPTLARFAQRIGVGVACVYRWARQFDEFGEALAEAQELQKSFIMEAGGVTMAAGFATFMLKSAHQMRDDDPIDDDDEESGDVEVSPQGKGQGE